MTPPNDPLLLALLDEDDWLRGRASRLARDTHVADDLVQEVWLAALRHRPDPRRKLQPWLERVLQSQHALSLRKRGRQRSEDLSESIASPPSTAAEVSLHEERLALLYEAIAGLDEPYRSTLRQRFFESRTVAEIADIHGQAHTTVRTRVHRGLARLRKALKRAGISLGGWFAMPKTQAVKLSSLGALVVLAVSCLIPLFLIRQSRGAPDSQLALATLQAQESQPADNPPLAMAKIAAEFEVPLGPQRTPLSTFNSEAGRLVEQDTQAPVANSEIGVRLDGVRMRPLITDGDGQFEWPEEWSGRELVLEIESENGEIVPRFARAPYGDTPWKIERFSGPVVAFELKNAPLERARDLYWILRSSVPFAGSVHVGPAESGTHLLAQLGTDGVWYGSPAAGLRLHGESFGGLEAASAHLTLDALSGTERLELVLEAKARLLVYHSTELDHRTEVSITSLEGTSYRIHFPPDGIDPTIGQTDDLLRPGALGGIPAGRYLLTWRAPGCAPEEVELDLRAGETTTHTIYPRTVLAANDQIVAILMSDSGRYTRSIFAVLEGEDGVQFIPAEWEAHEGKMRAIMTFTDVAASDHKLSVVPIADYMRWDHYTVNVHPGAAPQVFTCHDQAERDVLDFELVTEEGAALPIHIASKIRAEIQIEEGPLYTLFLLPEVADTPRRWSLASQKLSWLTRERAMPNVAQDALVRWTVFVGDDEVASGNEQSFGPPEEGVRQTKVEIPTARFVATAEAE